MKQKIIVTGIASHTKGFATLRDLIKELCKNVSFPCECSTSNEVDDDGKPILILPNGNEISRRYLNIK